MSVTSKPLAAVLSAMKSYADTKASLSTDGYVLSSRKVAGQALSADVTAATISSAIGLSNYLPLKGGTLANPNGMTDLWLSDGKSNGYAEIGVEKGGHYIEMYCTTAIT